MLQLESLEFRILNETSDDAENLEQIYRALSLEFSADRYDPADPNSYYWREAADAASLADIANAVKSLVEGGLLVVRHDPAQKPAEGDLSYSGRPGLKSVPRAGSFGRNSRNKPHSCSDRFDVQIIC